MNPKENALRNLQFDNPERITAGMPCHWIGYFGVNHEGYNEVFLQSGPRHAMGGRTFPSLSAGIGRVRMSVRLEGLCRDTDLSHPLLFFAECSRLVSVFLTNPFMGSPLI